MYKLFAIICLLTNGTMECTPYSDTSRMVYKDLQSCEREAQERFYGMSTIFEAYAIPFDKMVVGCDEIEEIN